MPKRTLAVDDNAVMRDVYLHLLSDEGYVLTVASDGWAALEALGAYTPDLVLLDIVMPKLSGWEVLETIPSTREWHDIPVLMVTGLIETSAAEADGYPRYDCYLTKKKTGKDLLVLVDKALEGTLDTTEEPTILP